MQHEQTARVHLCYHKVITVLLVDGFHESQVLCVADFNLKCLLELNPEHAVCKDDLAHRLINIRFTSINRPCGSLNELCSLSEILETRVIKVARFAHKSQKHAFLERKCLLILQES